MKQFAIIGLGNFGAKVARELTAMDCKVTAIDNDKSKVQAIQEDVYQAIIADATDRNFLENLEPKHFDYFVISTGEDAHAAILITLYLNELEAKHIIVKAASSDHAKVLKKVGAAEAIIPEEQMAIKLAFWTGNFFGGHKKPNVSTYFEKTIGSKYGRTNPVCSSCSNWLSSML